MRTLELARTSHQRLLAGRRPGERFAEAATFDDVPGAEVVPVGLPADLAPVPVSRSLGDGPMSGLLTVCPGREHPMRVAVVPDAVLGHDSGVVITADGRLVAESLWDDEHRRRNFDPPERLAPPVVLEGRYASLVSQYSLNFYHWTFEAFPRLAVLRASGVPFDKVLVRGPVTRFQYELLELAGIERERVVSFEGPVRVSELVWSAPLSPVGYPTPYAVEWLRGVYRPFLSDGEPFRRVYLTRTGTRRVVNEAELMDVVRACGFEVVDPDGLGLREQLRLFSETAYAIGPHGAAFSNVVASPRLTGVEFYQADHVNVSMPAVFAACGHEHWHLPAQRVAMASRRKNHHLKVSRATLADTLTAAGLT